MLVVALKVRESPSGQMDMERKPKVTVSLSSLSGKEQSLGLTILGAVVCTSHPLMCATHYPVILSTVTRIYEVLRLLGFKHIVKVCALGCICLFKTLGLKPTSDTICLGELDFSRHPFPET